MLSIIIPAYNERENIQTTVAAVDEVLTKNSIEYEIIVVDDHSHDETYAEVVSLNNSNIKCIRLAHRVGPHNAIRAGFRYASGDGAMCLGADGQEDYSVLPLMTKKWHEGLHVVWGLRTSRAVGIKDKLSNILFYKILNMANPHMDRHIDLVRADFFLIDRKLIDVINNNKERNTSIFGLIMWMGFKQGYVEYQRNERRAGQSKWNFRSRLKLATDWIVSFSGLPLRITTYLGFSSAALGFLYALVVLVNYFVGHPIEGWSSSIVIILFLGGLQMMMLGVLGEYLWRNYEQSKKRPLFLIESSSI